MIFLLIIILLILAIFWIFIFNEKNIVDWLAYYGVAEQEFLIDH